MRLIFMGTPEAAVPTLQRCLADGHDVVAVWTQPDRPSGRGNKIAISPVKQIAIEHRLTVHQPAKIKTDEAKALFASHDADLAVVVAYGRILPNEFLRAPRRGCVNVHFSLLPQYRGAAPVNWAIVNGDSKSGVTTMFIELQLDAGPILLQRETPIGESEIAPELMQRLSHIGADLLSETLSRLDDITPRAQNHQEASFAPLLKKEDGLIDWNTSAAAIERRVRGFQPWPNAYTHHQARRLIIWRAVAGEGRGGQAAAGEIVAAHGDDLVVKCGGETELLLVEVQPEGKRRMSARDYLNGVHSQIGERLE
jgi:methionyl-tRNA formyltransferase